MNGIKKITKLVGEFHMASATVERILQELKKNGKIKTRKVKNKICYYRPTHWNDEEKLEEDFKRIMRNIQKRIKKISSQFNDISNDGKHDVVQRLDYVDKGLFPTPESYFANILPNEPYEDQLFKMIKKLIKRSSSKSKQKMLEDAKTTCKKIKQLNDKISAVSRTMKKIDENTLRYSKLLHENNQQRYYYDELTHRLERILTNLEKERHSQ